MKDDHDNPSSRFTADSAEAMGRFCNGCNCSQSVLSVYAGRYGLDEATALRIATGLGGGVGRMGGTCGALTGAALVLGLEFGPVRRGDQAAKDRTYAATGDLQRRFIERHGSHQCKDLLQRDLSTEAGYRDAHAAGVFKSRCPHYVETAVNLLGEILRENGKS